MRIIASKFALATSLAVIALVAGCSAQDGSGTGGSPAGTEVTKIDDACKSASMAEIEAIAHYGINSLREETNPAAGTPNRSCGYAGSGHAVEVVVYEGEIICDDGRLTLPDVPGFGDRACGKGILFQVQVGRWAVRIATSEPPETSDNQALLQSVARLVVPRLKPS